MFGQLERWQRTLAIMFFAQFVTAIGFSIIFPFLPLYVESLGTSSDISIEFWAGMVFSSQALTMMIASPFWGALADRYGRKMMVQRAMFGGVVIIALMAFARSAEELVLLRGIQGFITGTVAAANALVAAAAPRDRTGFAMGTLQVGLWGGVAMGPMIGGPLADLFGYRVPFLVTAAMLFIAGVLVHFGVKEEFDHAQKTANKSKSFVSEWRHIFSMSGVLQTYVIRFLAGLSRSMVIPITPLFVAALLTGALTNAAAVVPDSPFYLDIRLAGNERINTYTGLVIGIASATATFSGVYLGRLGDRIGHRTVLIGSALVCVVLYIPQAFVNEVWQLLILQAMTGLAVGGLVAAPSALLARYTDPGEEGAVYGLDNSVLAGARAVAPLAGVAVAVWLGLRATFLSIGVVFLVVALVSVFLLPKTDRVQAQMQSDAEDEPDWQKSVA